MVCPLYFSVLLSLSEIMVHHKMSFISLKFPLKIFVTFFSKKIPGSSLRSLIICLQFSEEAPVFSTTGHIGSVDSLLIPIHCNSEDTSSFYLKTLKL